VQWWACIASRAGWYDAGGKELHDFINKRRHLMHLFCLQYSHSQLDSSSSVQLPSSHVVVVVMFPSAKKYPSSQVYVTMVPSKASAVSATALSTVGTGGHMMVIAIYNNKTASLLKNPGKHLYSTQMWFRS